MATGFIPAGFHFALAANAGATTLLTVPSSPNHKYILKALMVYLKAASNTASTFHLTVSDTSGVNDKQITPEISSQSTTGQDGSVQLGSLESNFSGTVTSGQLFAAPGLFDMVLEPGQILKIVPSGVLGGLVNGQLSYIDYTV